ncbi:hypothetical protein DFH27DRAFT_96007 [Peziza echinospora]|nr:hypothetical protein DFH27DRAFT_96007 [Peziza echinospora]
MPERPSTGKIVFVGNIPYGLTEEQISEIFSSVGRVVSFRLVYDRETGRPKGFGFAEYQDPETAASAVRNLDGHEVMGRKLRVDFSHEGNAPDIDSGEVFGSAMGGFNGGSSSQGGAPGGPTPSSSSLPPLPPGVDVPPTLQATEVISQTLKTLPPTQLLDILSQMKQLAITDPMKAADLLRQAPQLSYAIFQALLLMNLVDTSVLTQVIETASQQPAAAPTPSAPPQQQVSAPYGYPQPSAPIQQSYQQPPAVPQHQIPPPQQQQPQVTDQRAELIRQVMQLTPEQISALHPDQQSQIFMLKQQLMGSQGGGY